MLRHVLVSDATGHLSEHCVVCRSWLTPCVVEVDIPPESPHLTPPPRLTSFPFACAHNEKEDAATPRASQATAHPQPTTFQDCSGRFASCGLALVSAAVEVYGAERTTSILGEIQDLRLCVSRAVSDGNREISPYLRRLACAPLLVFSRRMTDVHLRDHTSLFHFMEGGTGIRAHNGTLYCDNKGAWSMFAGLISDALLGRSKIFFLEVEGLFRALPPKTKRKEADIIAAVLQVLCDQHHACEEDLSRTLRQNCFHGMATGRRPVLPEPYVDARIDPVFDRDEDRFAAPVTVEAENSVPWTVHVANALVRVSGALLSQLVSKKFFQMLIEWCDTQWDLNSQGNHDVGSLRYGVDVSIFCFHTLMNVRSP